MPTRMEIALLRQLNTLFQVGTTGELTDGQLLERFNRGRGEAAELAFAALVERHGAMVLRVCRAQLADPHDTQDAFQATFLILLEKAHALWVRDSLGPWLHRVAFRTASGVRSATARRRSLERQAVERAASLRERVDRPDSERAPEDARELEQLLHEEINRLPECYRAPIVLCDLQGYTCEATARCLGRPVGTVKSWRSRGHERLRRRLIRRGVAPSAGLIITLAADISHAASPAPELEEAIRRTARALCGQATAGGIPASVQALAKGVLTTMLLGQVRTNALTAFALIFLAAGLWTAARVGANDPDSYSPSTRPSQQAETPNEPPRAAFDRPIPDPADSNSKAQDDRTKTWRLSLRDAIRIGLDNAEWIRLLSLGENGKPIEIAPIRPGDAPEFKAEVMALVRAIEEKYWALSQQHAQRLAAQQFLELVEDIVKREEAEHARGVARLRLEQARLDLVTKTSDAITSERGLRDLLRLPPADARRMVPITPPTEARLEPDWQKCRAAMLENQPDVFRARAELMEALDATPRGSNVDRVVARRFYDKVVEMSRALSCYIQEVEASYQQFRAASSLRASAAQRLEVERAFFEEGRIKVDRYLGAAWNHASAVSQEAQFKARYNSSIITLEWAKGTLLEYDQIAVVTAVRTNPEPSQARDHVRPGLPEVGTGPLEPSRLAPPPPVPPPPHTAVPAPAPIPPETRIEPHPSPAPTETPKTGLTGRTVSFELTLTIGSRPIELRGSFTIRPAPDGEGAKAR